ncbi:Hsp20/alpha crystallin family protein [Sulfobacillus acidophilus]|uniref:Hsp20/alpha crystallin family protein n=1 Tax=Sulfobacillus acidophilus TaxID=53633 RepID=A0ABS3AVB5_9FIRM|nr:Hsp20/alpha crystallin family protein [Sulfobacillus acidophilus]
MKPVKWEPFGEMKNFFGDFLDFPQMVAKNWGFDLAVDLSEKGGNLIAEVNASGLDPKKIKVSIRDDILTLSGTREEKREKKYHNYYSKEIRRGSFERIVRLPSCVESSKAKASYKNGILEITMPKKARSAQGEVKVKIE